MGENGGCLQSCQTCCYKRFKSVHSQATVLQSCKSKLLTLNLFKRCKTKQLRTNFIDNLGVMLQRKNKVADAVEEVSESQNTLRQFKFKFKFKYSNFCCCNNHVWILYHSTLGNILRYIWGHCCQQWVSGACIHNYVLQITVWCDYLSMPWRNLYSAAKGVYRCLHEHRLRDICPQHSPTRASGWVMSLKKHAESIGTE